MAIKSTLNNTLKKTIKDKTSTYKIKKFTKKNKEVQKRTRSPKMNLLMRMTLRIHQANQTAHRKWKESEIERIVQLVRKRTRRNWKRGLRTNKERKNKKKTKINLRRSKRRRAISEARAVIERKSITDD